MGRRVVERIWEEWGKKESPEVAEEVLAMIMEKEMALVPYQVWKKRKKMTKNKEDYFINECVNSLILHKEVYIHWIVTE